MSEIRVENIIGETGTDAVKFTKGINVTGVTTATSFSGSGASLTSLPAANLTGTLPAIDGSNLTNVSAGKVIKYALASSTTVDQYGAQNSYTLVGPQLTYTGTSASNKLIIHHNHHMVIEQPDNWFMALWRDGTSGTKLVEKKWYGQDQQWIGHTGIHVCVVDIPDTSSHTYQFAIYRTSGTNRMIYNHSVGVAQIIALEIDPS